MEGFKQAEVKRQDGLLTISWDGDNLGVVKIYQSANPDAVEADKIFSVCMGEEVEPRRQFIESNSSYANLDI